MSIVLLRWFGLRYAKFYFYFSRDSAELGGFL